MNQFHHPANDKTELPAMSQDAGKVLSQERELAPLINSAVSQYEASGIKNKQ